VLQVAYGSNIAAFPAGGHLHVSHLTDVAGKGAGVPGNYAAFGVAPSGKGKVAVFSDTNCLDSSHNVSACGRRCCCRGLYNASIINTWQEVALVIG
jgi:hypothetical protein